MLATRFALAVLFFQPVLPPRDIGLSGTMIVLFPTDDAISVCADKRQTASTGSFNDGDYKITIVDRRRGFVSSGATRFVAQDGLVTFDADSIAKAAITAIPVDSLDWSPVSAALASGLKAYLLSKEAGARPPTRRDDSGKPVLFAVTAFFLDSSDAPRVCRFTVEYENTLPTPVIQVLPEDKSGKVLFDGGYKVAQRIMDPTTDLTGMPAAVRSVVTNIRAQKAHQTALAAVLEILSLDDLRRQHDGQGHQQNG